MANNKTALDELSEWVNENQHYPEGVNEHIVYLDELEKKIAELRATTERELLIEANKKGKWQQSVENSNPYQSHITPEQWYNETYGTDEQ